VRGTKEEGMGTNLGEILRFVMWSAMWFLAGTTMFFGVISWVKVYTKRKRLAWYFLGTFFYLWFIFWIIINTSTLHIDFFTPFSTTVLMYFFVALIAFFAFCFLEVFPVGYFSRKERRERRRKRNLEKRREENRRIQRYWTERI